MIRLDSRGSNGDAEQQEDDWIYAPPQGVRDLMSGQIRQRPYNARVFGLPKTHTIEHAGAAGDEHLDFLVWALSFFVGMRLTTTEAGFLDATPARRGTLVDFVAKEQTISKGMELAERFWTNNRAACKTLIDSERRKNTQASNDVRARQLVRF